MTKPIKVMIVDDSATARKVLENIFESDPNFQVICTASDGEDALCALEQRGVRPDIVTMDINMPRMDGYETTARILKKYPLPIIVVSAAEDPDDRMATFRVIECGALAFVAKPQAGTERRYEADAARVLRMARVMSEVKIVRRCDQVVPTQNDREISDSGGAIDMALLPRIEAVAIGASAGGPQILREILAMLPSRIPYSVFIAQHISEDFTDGFVDWLKKICAPPVHKALHGEHVVAGHIYIAPGGKSMQVSHNGVVQLSAPAAAESASPSVDLLFQSFALAFGEHGAGIILSGMGSDGVEGMMKMCDSGAVTLAQDEQSSIVYGMPKQAARSRAAKFIASTDQIGSFLVQLATKERANECG